MPPSTSIGPCATLHVSEHFGFGAAADVVGLTPRPGIAVAEDAMLFELPAFRMVLGVGVEF